MADAEVIETVDIAEPEVITAPEVPTRADLKEKGWSAQELDTAEKRGMIPKPEDAADKKKEADTKAKADAEAKVKATPDPVEKVESDVEIKDRRKTNAIPDFTFQTPEQEKAFLDAFGAGTPQRAMYFRMKNERQARQGAQQAQAVAEKRAKDLEARIAELEKTKTPPVDEFGNVIDPEEKPLTLKELKAIQLKEKEEFEKKQQELNSHARVVADAQITQEEYARSLFPDFDDTVGKAKDVMQNLEQLVPEKWKQAKVVKLVRELQVAAAQADKLDLDDYHAAIIAHEIGQFHPDYGKAAKNGEESEDGKDGPILDPKKANGSRLTPEQMKRIEKNTQRGASSASVSGGGGKRTISIDDVDSATLNGFSYAKRQEFKQKYPDRYAKLLRG